MRVQKRFMVEAMGRAQHQGKTFDTVTLTPLRSLGEPAFRDDKLTLLVVGEEIETFASGVVVISLEIEPVE